MWSAETENLSVPLHLLLTLVHHIIIQNLLNCF